MKNIRPMKKMLWIMLVIPALLFCSKKKEDLSAGQIYVQERDTLPPIDSTAMTHYYTHDPFFGSYHSIYGDWQFVNYSGGFTGGTFPSTYTQLSIMPYGRYLRAREKALIEEGKIAVVQEDENMLIVKFIPDHYDSLNFRPMPQTCILTGDTLRINDPCCDMFSYFFRRIR